MTGQVIQIPRWLAVGSLALALTGGGLLGSLASGGGRPGSAPAAASLAPAAGSPAPAAPSLPGSFAPVVREVLPAVVNISSSKVVRVRDSGPISPFFNDPFFRQFFGDQFERRQEMPREERERSLGSGVIVRKDGIILTNNHVVQGATEIKVSLRDKREFKAKLVGTDPKTDVAVLRIDARDLPTLPLGDSSKLQIGDLVLAVGDPFGIGETVTMGIVSATGRGGLDIEDYEDFIQTDAAINPGNSGGALVDAAGRLVGINTAILSGGSGGNQGIGFAIPINMAQAILSQILEHGKVVRGYLGVSIQAVTPAMAKAFGLDRAAGALVGDVTPGGPASKAGIRKGDVILEMDGEKIPDSNELRLRISQKSPGSSARLKLFRDGREMTVTVTLGELPEKLARSEGGGEGSDLLQGVEVEDLTSRTLRELGLPPGTRGVVVTSVDEGSPAAEAGLSRGDVIQEVNRKPVASVPEFQEAIRRAGKNPILLLVNRQGTTVYLMLEP